MFKKTLQHLGQVLVTVIGVTFLTFSLSFLAPGDPVLMILETADTMVSQELIDHTRQELGLDKPFLVQYGNWLSHAVQGLTGYAHVGECNNCDATRHSRPHGGYRSYLPE